MGGLLYYRKSEMRNLKIVIEYDGTDFNGWQIQKNGERTVQGELSKACGLIFKQDVKIIGSGRTDSGVHAKGQVAHFCVDTRMKSQEIQRALNSRLSHDICVTAVKEVDAQFHAQYSAKEKTYRYTILNSQTRSVFLRRWSYLYLPSLDIAIMRKAARDIKGRHDFKSFQAYDPLRADRDTVRTVKRLTIKREDDLICIDITANGFLYKMVRNIVGTLIAVGARQIAVDSIPAILKAKNRDAAKNTAPAHGLCLMSVNY